MPVNYKKRKTGSEKKTAPGKCIMQKKKRTAGNCVDVNGSEGERKVADRRPYRGLRGRSGGRNERGGRGVLHGEPPF